MTEPDSEDPSRLFADPPPASAEAQKPRRRRWLWAVVGLLVAVPLALTLAGALTSPPHVKGVPVGHLVYLDADQPSDHTAMLRGLRVMGPDGSSRQILHEYEPQDLDAGSREWITQPKESPDGKWLAFEKQLITLHEEQQAIDNQLWVVPLTGPNPQPRMLLDLTQHKLKQFVGLAWTPNSQNIVFLQDTLRYDLPVQGGPPKITKFIRQRPNKLPPSVIFDNVPPLLTNSNISETQNPIITINGTLNYTAVTNKGTWFIVTWQNNRVDYEGGLFAIHPNGHQMAFVWATTPDRIIGILEARDPRLPVQWGWSVFGKRHITALHWSPDGKYLAYSVSKPPFEDELFYIDLATGKCFQLPVRTGRAGWDWGP